MNLVFFQNDQRLHDNEGILIAERLQEPWIGVVIEPVTKTFKGVQRTSAKRRKAWRHAAHQFKQSVEENGGTLLLLQGPRLERIKELIDRLDPENVIYGIEPGIEEKRLYKELDKYTSTKTHHASWLWHPADHDRDYRDVSNTFTQFRRYVEQNSAVRKPIQQPAKLNGAPRPNIDDEIPFTDPLEHHEHSLIPFTLTEQEAKRRLQHYLEEDLPKSYKYTRNKSLGIDKSTKFSVFLANGSMSPREAYHAIERYEDQYGSTKSTYWVKFELTWRDFFKYQAMKHGEHLYTPGGIQRSHVEWDQDPARISSFTEGRTGYPFVDAGMRELTKTGFISNRVRQNVASFFTKNLHQDWRIGAAIFEKHLLDYDTASNYGNWQYVSGVGNDSRSTKYFNVIGQSKKYEAAQYIKQWVPELRGIQDQHVYEPWTMSEGQQAMYGFKYGETYPKRIVNFKESIREMKKRY